MAYKLPYPPPSQFFSQLLIKLSPSPSPGLKIATPTLRFLIFKITPTIPHPYIFSHPHPQIFIFSNTPTIPTFFSHTPPGGRELKKNMGVGVINWGGQRSARQLCAAKLWHTEQCTTTVRRKLVAHIMYQNSARQLCAADLRRTLCTRTVRDKLVAHIVCQNSARQLCAAYLWRTLCARTVRQKSNLHTKNAFAANAPQL